MSQLVVIDTNVLVSALLSKHDNSATVKVMNMVFEGRVTPVYNEEILNEYWDVLHRKKLDFSSELIGTVVGAIKYHGNYTVRIATGKKLPDPKDLVFYEVTMARRHEQAMLVTGNKKHFPQAEFIVTPSEFCELKA